jgi:ABC-type transport system involved in multi-copper enzyme maturation permease subunit
MTRLVRVELLKLRTMRVTYGLLAAAVAVTALFSSLEASRAGRSVPPVSTAAGLGDVTTVGGVAMILACVLGVIVTSGEFRHTTATLTYLAVPDRRRVLGAKAVAAALAGACYGFAAGIVATTVGLVFVAADGDRVTLGTATMIGHIVGAGAGAAVLAVLGVIVGSLIRAQLAGVIGVFVWCMVIESILGGTVSAIRPYLPYTVSTTLGGAKLGAGAFGPGYSVSGQQALPFLAGAALVLGVAAALAAVASRTTVRRDIT